MNENELPPPASTKDRILDAAERLFARGGFEATSLRAITTEAGVNLAAVNYHFQSKDALLHAVIERRFGPVNRRRIEMLDELEARAGNGRLPIREVINAFVRPVLELARADARCFAPMVGRVFIENEEFVDRFFRKHLAPIAERFRRAFGRAMPEVPEVELLWRAHFLIGAMAHTMTVSRLLLAFSGGQCTLDDIDAVVERFVHVFTAVFEAPVEEVQHAR